MLYHATFGAHLESIKTLGLGAKQIKNWEFSLSGVVYLSDDAEYAFSFAECSEDTSKEVYNSGIYVLGIPKNALTENNLSFDENNHSEDDLTYTYNKIISPDNLFVITRNNGIIGKLKDLDKISQYED